MKTLPKSTAPHLMTDEHRIKLELLLLAFSDKGKDVLRALKLCRISGMTLADAIDILYERVERGDKNESPKN